MRGRLRGCVVLHAAGNAIGISGCSALAQALPHLSALQQLNLGGNWLMFIVLRGRLRGCVVSHAADNSIGPSGCSALAQALPHLSALQQLDLKSNLIIYVLSICFY